jgi:hypothetical protein
MSNGKNSTPFTIRLHDNIWKQIDNNRLQLRQCRNEYLNNLITSSISILQTTKHAEPANAQYGYCPICHKYDRLINHHWYEYNKPNYHPHRKICSSCNTILIPIEFYDISVQREHYLPDWNTQIQHVRIKYPDRIKQVIIEENTK